MGEKRIVRKYTNRRLYDLTESRYVTLAELCTRVGDGIELSVIDSATKQDITCTVLFQMVISQEIKGATPAMSRDFLLQTIRSRAETPSWMVATFLEQVLKLFTLLQTEQKNRGAEVVETPTSTALRFAEANYRLWCSLRSQICQMVADSESGDPEARGRQVDSGAPVTVRRPERRLRKSPRQLESESKGRNDVV